MTEMHGVHDYDLIVVGSGSGNSLIDEEWKDKKSRSLTAASSVATCLNKGCIPTKMYVVAKPRSLIDDGDGNVVEFRGGERVAGAGADDDVVEVHG